MYCIKFVIVHLDVNGVNPVIFLFALLRKAIELCPNTNRCLAVIYILSHCKLT